MDYAQDTHCTELDSQISDWLDKPLIEESNQKWLLVDGAILGEKITKKMLRVFGANRAYNIFAGSEFSAYTWRAPHLIYLDHGGFRQNELFALLRDTDRLPAVALIESGADPKQVCDHLRWLAHVRTCDDLDLYCRFADTRIAPGLIEVLSDVQREVLRQCVWTWHIVGRHGRLTTIFQSDGPPNLPKKNLDLHSLHRQFILSDEQYLKLMRTAEADEMFQMLCEGAPELVPLGGRANFYVLLASLVSAARDRRLKHGAEIYQFIVIALTTRPDFFLNSVLEKFWQEVKSGTTGFSVLVSEWSDETWDSLNEVPCRPQGIEEATGPASGNQVK